MSRKTHIIIGIVLLSVAAAPGWGQTNNLSMIPTNVMAWNFVENAKYLTQKERDYYNAQATYARRLQGYGFGSVELVAAEVRAVEIVGRLLELLSAATNKTTQWTGSVVVEHPRFEIGFRSDGVVVWREKKQEKAK